MLNIGDLICYNACGQRKKTIGLIIDCHSRTDNGKVKGMDIFYQIQWASAPDILPRPEWYSPKQKNTPSWEYGKQKQTNWFKHGDWFEVIKNK